MWDLGVQSDSLFPGQGLGGIVALIAFLAVGVLVAVIKGVIALVGDLLAPKSSRPRGSSCPAPIGAPHRGM
jgi:hypothetical protein